MILSPSPFVFLPYLGTSLLTYQTGSKMSSTEDEFPRDTRGTMRYQLKLAGFEARAIWANFTQIS